MRRRLAALGAAFAFLGLLLPALVHAQGTMQGFGTFTAGHLVFYAGNGQFIDAGGPTAAGGTPTNSILPGTRPTGLSIVNSGQSLALYSGYSSSAYSELTAGFDGGGNALFTVATVGGATPSCNFSINGTLVPCGGGNGSLSFITPTGANTPSTVGDLFARSMSLLDFGAVCDGVTNTDSAWTSAKAWAQPIGGTIRLPPGKVCRHNSLIDITASGVVIDGGSSGAMNVSGTGATLKWGGTCGAGTRMMSIVAPSGSTSNYRLERNAVRNVKFDGNNGCAADGLYLAGLYRPQLDRLLFTGFNGGNVLDIEPASAKPGTTFASTDDPGTQKGEFTAIDIRQSGYTSVPLRLGAYYDSAAWHNASYNYFEGLSIIGNGAVAGIFCVGCDNQTFIETNIAGTSLSVDMSIAVSGANLFPANGNTFNHYLGTGSFIARGQTTFPTCTAVAYPLVSLNCTWANIIRDADRTNGSVSPTIEPGAQLTWEDNTGAGTTQVFFGVTNLRPGLIVSNEIGNYNTCRQAAIDNAAENTSLYGCDGSQGDIYKLDNANGSRFGVYLDGAGNSANLAFRRRAGTGHYVLDQPLIGMPTSSWTPVLTFGGLSTGITYGTQSGTYTQIGKMVVARFSIVLTSKGSAVGDAVITGLPVAASGAGNGVCTPSYYTNMASITNLIGVVTFGGTICPLFLTGATAAALLLDTNFTNTSRVDGMAVYFTN